VGDSGATRTLLTEDTSNYLKSGGVIISQQEPIDVVYGGGEKGCVSSRADLGELEVLFVPGLSENLVSLSDFTERGSEILLTQRGGEISNPFNDQKIRLREDHGTWRILLSDIANYSHRSTGETEEGSTLKARNAGFKYANRAHAICSPTKSKLGRYISLHERSCHQPPDVLIKAIEGESPRWIRSGITAEEIRSVGKNYTCVPCILSKRKKKSVSFNLEDPEGFYPGLNSKNAEPGNIISIDPVGPISPKSISGYTIMWIVIDITSTYQWCFFSDNKRASTVTEILRIIVTELKYYERVLRIVRSDSEEIFNSQEVQLFLDGEGIRHQTSVPYEHYQNRVERAIQLDVRGISSILHAQKWLPANYWEYAAKHFIRVNRYVPNRRTGRNTPASILGVGDLDLSVKFLFAFGDFVAVTIPDVKSNWKFDMRRDLGIYLGDADGTKRGCLILNPSSGAVQIRLDCIKLELTDSMLQNYYGARDSLSNAKPMLRKIMDAKINFDEDYFRKSTYEEEKIVAKLPLTVSWEDLDAPKSSGGDGGSSSSSSSSPSFRNLRHNPRVMSAKVINVPQSNWSILHPFMRPKAYGYEAKITVGKALQMSDSAQWIEALNVEINQMIDTHTLEPILVYDVPRGSTVINSTVVLRKKPTKYKARLCACGNELKGQIAETYSPTIGALTYATVHQIAVIDRMRVRVIDTIGAYLYQTYPDDKPPIFVRIPAKVMEACGIPSGTLFRIKKYIYGLPDAGLAYYNAYSSLLTRSGYLKSKSDPCLFLKINLERGERIYIWAHVDDTFIAATEVKLIDELEACIKSQFQITVTEEVDTYLGIHFERLENGDVKITQPLLLQSLFDEYASELQTHKVRQPISSQRLQGARSAIAEPMDASEYLHLEGALIYLTKSRPDIQTAVSFGATHSVNPTRKDFEELIHCLKYLQSTRYDGLIIKAGEPFRDLVLRCYVDASYLTHPDSKSHQGFCLSFGEIGSFYSKSSKQQLVSTSSTQSEIRALQTVIVEIIFIIELCKELGRPILLPAIIFEDNAAVIALSKEMTSRAKRCKHFLMAINYIREQVQLGLVQVDKIATEFNRADLLTKILTGFSFRSNAELLLGSKLNVEA
jgi:hypothetical protein